MAYIKFLNSEKVYNAIVIPDGNIVTLTFDSEKEVSNAGFDLFDDEACEVDIGSNFYHDFTTIYRNDAVTSEYNGYQLSKDGSVYVEPEPYIPTLKEVQEEKVIEMENNQAETIQYGVDVQLSDGSVKHFTLTANDQISLMGLQAQIAQGVDQIPWHTSDQEEHCEYYSNTDMALIVTKAMSFVTYHVTYLRDLRIYIRSLQDKDTINEIQYGDDIPLEYQSEVLKSMLAERAIA